MTAPDRFDLKFRVTEEDIACGRQRSACECPQARAIVREVSKVFPEAKKIEAFVCFDTSTVYVDDAYYYVDTPKEVEDFFQAFDGYGGRAGGPASVSPTGEIGLSFARRTP